LSGEVVAVTMDTNCRSTGRTGRSRMKNEYYYKTKTKMRHVTATWRRQRWLQGWLTLSESERRGEREWKAVKTLPVFPFPFFFSRLWLPVGRRISDENGGSESVRVPTCVGSRMRGLLKLASSNAEAVTEENARVGNAPMPVRA
jgi:hypothetical protein